MDEAEVANIAEHITLSWPQVLEPGLAAKWITDFKPLDYQTMIVAVDNLRRTQDFQPTTATLMRAYQAARVELTPPALPALGQQDKDRPYNKAWRLLMETWVVLRDAKMKAAVGRKSQPWAEHRFAVVTQEIRELEKRTREMMPNGPDAVAPPNLVALAVAAQERVRQLLFEEPVNA